MSADVTFRPARRDESRTIARLFQIASGGVADYVWSIIAEPGEALIDAGERRFARANTGFSYENCTVAARAGGVIGMMHAFAMGEAAPGGEAPDPVLRPYAELEVAGSLYIAGMALIPEHRGQGLGSRLISLAKERARAEGLMGVSLIAFEENAGSVRLYRREGFREVDRRAVVPHELIRYGGDALLMLAD